MTESFYKLPPDLTRDIESYASDVQRFLNGEIAPRVFQARRVPLGIYEQREDGTYMVRVRIAGGVMNGEQIRMLAELSKIYGNNQLHVTTRQDIQFHDVRIADTPEIMRRLMLVDLSSKGGGGNTVRNITACPYAGICPHEIFDITHFTHAVTEYLIALPGSYNLPRKYKIAFSGCAADCAFARVNDLGFIASLWNGKPGFTVYAGGGMGAHSRMADLLEEWMPAEDATRAAETVRRLFDRMGNRHDRYQARLRFVFARIGPEAFREAFRREMKTSAIKEIPEFIHKQSVLVRSDSAGSAGIRLRQVYHALKRDLPSQSPGAQNLSFFPQRQGGFVAVLIPLPFGMIAWNDLLNIADIADEFSAEKCVRSTPTQNLLLRFVAENNLSRLADAFLRLSPGAMALFPMTQFVACAGASTCRMGLCLSRNAVKACAEVLAGSGISEAPRPDSVSGRGNLLCRNSPGYAGQVFAEPSDLSAEAIRAKGEVPSVPRRFAFGRTKEGEELLGDLNVHISGCPNACGRHPIADIGFYGAALRNEDRLVPGYRVVLGSRHNGGNACLARPAGTVPARALPGFLVELLQNFQKDRLAVYQVHCMVKSFADFVDRKGTAFFEDIAKKHMTIPAYADNPDFYRDWGQATDFSLAGRGAGECGAGVFEVIREDIALSGKALQRAEKEGGAVFEAFLPAVRALLITRGVDTQNPDEIIRLFETHFVDKGLVAPECRALLAKGRGYVQGWKDALHGQLDNVRRLLDRVELLFSTLDADLKFHPPEKARIADTSAPTKAGVTDERRTTGSVATVELDLSGVACPMNFVKAKLKLESLEKGAILSVILDEGEPVRNVPASFRSEGQDVLEMSDIGSGHWKVLIRKTK